MSAVWVHSPYDGDPRPALEKYIRTLDSIPRDCELIIVANGVRPVIAKQIKDTVESGNVVTKIITFYRMCDEAVAVATGLESASGDIVAVLPNYLQVDPDALFQMLKLIEEGNDYVASWRYPRVDSRASSSLSKTFNWLTNRLTGVKLHDINSNMRMMTKQLVEETPVHGDLHRFLPILAARQGFRVTEVQVKHLSERNREGDYGVGVYLRRLLDLLSSFFLVKFTRKPLRFFGLIGGTAIALGGTITAAVGLLRILGLAPADRPMLLLGLILCVLGVQLFSLGLLGELIIFTYGAESREYHIDSIHDWDPNES